MSTVEHPSSGESQHATEKALNAPSSMPSGLAGYRAVLGLPGVAAFLGVTFLARIPSTATGIALGLHVVLTLDLGYFEVGLVTALYTIGRTIGSPLLGLLLDRRGLRTMLVVATSVEASFWIATPWLSYPMLVGGALVSGLLGLPVSALIRQTLAVVEYEWHASSEPFLRHFEVAAWEVVEVLYSPRRWSRPATTAQGLAVLTVWGRTEDGRPLVVVLRPRSHPDRWQILMAAPMGDRQLAEFTAWEATRDE